MNIFVKYFAAAALLAAGYGLHGLQPMLVPHGASSGNAHMFGTLSAEEIKAASDQLQGTANSPALRPFASADFGSLYALALATVSLALFVQLRRRPPGSPLAVRPAARAAALTPSLERTAAFRINAEKPVIPRSLLRNPYGPETQHLSFDERVQIAAEASLRESRVIGAICFRVSLKGGAAQRDVTAPDSQHLEPLADFFRTRLRSTDCVRITGQDEIMVFVSLLDTLQHLRNITARLVAAVQNCQDLPNLQIGLATGAAMYPIDGYSGAELIASARKRLPRPREASHAEEAPATPAPWHHPFLAAEASM